METEQKPDPTKPTEHETAFAAYLVRLRDESRRGALPALRRGLGRDERPPIEMYRWLGPWLSREPSGTVWSERCHFAVASLFASHPLEWPAPAEGEEPAEPTNMGASLARLRGEAGLADRRMAVLLSSGRDTVLDGLVPLADLCKRAEVPIDWAQLLHDLLRWGNWIRTQWARAFWGHEEEGIVR